MKRFIKNLKPHYLISAVVVSGVVFAATNFNFNQQPLFSNTNNFVLFSEKEITLEQETQISSGDLGSNNKLDIQKDNIINGNLFAKEISIDKNTTVNGNTSFNKLKFHKDSQILGVQTKPVKLPIASLPQIPNFTIGNQNLTFTGTSTLNILTPGSYRNIILEKNSRLTLIGGTYNLRKLELKENSTLIYNASTTINIQFKLKGQQKTSILPGNNNLSAIDLSVNYIGTRPKNDKEREDDDSEIESELDDQEKKDHKTGQLGRPVIFKKDSFLNFKLLAPKADVKFGERTTLRGQVLARKVKIGKDSILSREDAFNKATDSGKIIEFEDVELVANEIIIQLTSTSTVAEATVVADFLDGKIAGQIPQAQIYKLELLTENFDELNSKLQQLGGRQFPFVILAVPNMIGGLR